MKITTLSILVLMILASNPVKADDLDDFVPADGQVISSGQISDGAITSDKIADGAVNANKLGTSAVTNAHLSANAVTSDKILNGTVETADLADGAVDGGKISNNSIQAIDIQPETLTANEISAGAITNSELGANAVTSSKILDGTIVAEDLGASAVTSSKILDGTIAAEDLGANAVTSSKILNGSILAEDLAANVISTIGGKYTMLDLGSGIRTSLNIGTVGSGYGAAPVLRYDDGDSYARWSLPLPDDYVAGTDIIVQLYWSPSDNNAGNVKWVVDYAALASGELVPGSASFISKTYTQASPGVTLTLANTASNIAISAADIAPNDMLNIVIRRSGSDGADTYADDVNLHLAKIIYQAKRVN